MRKVGPSLGHVLKKKKKSGKTRVETWLVQKLVAAFETLHEGTTKLEMPPFQRGVVWSQSKQKDLIRSLKSGYPVGSLLFYKQPPDEDGIEVCLLIDGLQRTTAIRDYCQRPLEFIGSEELNASLLEDLVTEYNLAAGSEHLKPEFERAVLAWMSSTRTLEAEDGFDVPGLQNSLDDYLGRTPPSPTTKAFVSSARAFQKDLRAKCEIDSIEVPVLFYDGKESDLPDIFEKINATGTKLTKYEIFAASWVKQNIEITNEKVREAIRRRYQSLQNDQNISVNGIRADGTPERLSLFDYLFGLGRLLADEYPLLFGSSDEPTAMESVAFSLATVCHRLPLSRMKELTEKMDREPKTGNINPKAFEDALLESAAFVKGCLAPYIELKLNSENTSSGGAHTDLQIASMVARALAGSYVPGTWEPRERAKEDRAALVETLPQHYLLDVLQQRWRGSGDSRLYKMVWEEFQDDTPPSVPSTPYLQRYDAVDFDRVLDQWFSDQIKLNQRSRSYVMAPARVFLRYIYSSKISVKDEKKVTFELDHLFPVSRLVALAKDDADGWPISAVANLALFDWQTNREKSKLDLIQYLEKVPDHSRAEKKQAIEKFVFLPPDDASIPRDADGNDMLTRSDYIEFLKARFEIMKGLARVALGIPSEEVSR